MSIRHNLLPIAIVIGVGLVSGKGSYIFGPEIEDLEKKKRGEPLEIAQLVKSEDAKSDVQQGQHSDRLKATVIADDAKFSPPEQSSTAGLTLPQGEPSSEDRSKQTLPAFLQPWDARKK
ncbi:MAG: hypothetical protein Q9196_001271 [Gyalolechia fulgens]